MALQQLNDFLGSSTGQASLGAGGALLNQINFHQSMNHQKDMLKMQQQFAEKMAKNKHSYEVESLLKAGLNPALAHGTSELVGSPSAPSTPTSNNSNLANKGLTQIELDTLEAQRDSQKAVARQQNADATIKEIDAMYRVESNIVDIALKRAQTGLSDTEKLVMDQKVRILREFRYLGGVRSYIDNQGSQTALNDITHDIREEEKKFVAYNAFTQRLNALANKETAAAYTRNAKTNEYNAETQRFMARSQHGVNNAILKEKKAVTDKERNMCYYYGAMMACAQNEADLKAAEAEARKNLGPIYAGAVVFMNDLLSFGERGADIALSIKSKGLMGKPQTTTTKNESSTWTDEFGTHTTGQTITTKR